MPLVGRGPEQEALRRLLDHAAAGQGGLVLVSGEPGIGKRSLIADLTAYARSRDAVVLTGRAAPGSGPYRAVSDALLPLVRAGRVRETPALRPFRSALGRILPGWATPEPLESGIDPVLLLGEGVLRLLLELAAPVRVLVLEDLADADPDTLALLAYLAPAVAELPVLLLGSQTEPPPDAVLDGLPATRLRLGRLSDAETAALVDGLRRVPASVRDAVVQRAEGLPLVASALTESLSDDAEPDRLPGVPDSYAALVAARLARLDHVGRRLLAAAAVLGAPATWSLVPALADLDDAAAGAGYARALALGLLVAEAGSLRWPHPLVREAVWSGLLPLEQDRLNRRAAELLLGLDSDDGDTAAAERLALAGETDRAAEVLVRLARRALDQGGLHRAEEWLCRAAGLGRPVEVARLSVELLDPTGRPAAALEIGEPALEQARHDEHADLCLQLAAAAVEAGQWARAEELATRAGRPDDPRSLMVRADAAHGAGLVAEAAELANRAVSAAAGAAAEVRCEAGCVQGRILRLGSPAAARDAFAAAAQTRQRARSGPVAGRGAGRAGQPGAAGRRAVTLAAGGASPGRPGRPARAGGPSRDPARRRAPAHRRSCGDGGTGDRVDPPLGPARIARVRLRRHPGAGGPGRAARRDGGDGGPVGPAGRPRAASRPTTAAWFRPFAPWRLWPCTTWRPPRCCWTRPPGRWRSTARRRRCSTSASGRWSRR